MTDKKAVAQFLYPTVVSTLWPQEDSQRIIRNIILAIFGSMLLTASAKIQVPFFPVPQTMQTFVVLVLSMLYGWRLGAATMLLYLAEGAFGLPVFAGTPEKGIGIVYMTGTTGGYLVGFVLATIVCGGLAERGWDRKISTTALAMLLGNLVIYIPGLLWLAKLIGTEKAIQFGLIPFVVGDITKLVLAAVSLPLVWSALKSR